jgi:hypothetical protein
MQTSNAPKIVEHKRVHQSNYTRNALEENRTAKRVEKTLHKNKKEKYTKDKLEKLEHLRHRNKRKVFFVRI